MKPEDHIIVIGRQYGSGGRQLGHLLSEKLGIPYYDKELLRQAADSLGFRSDVFEKSDERRSSKLFSILEAACGANTYFTSGALHDDTVYKLQSDVIRALLEKGPCVIVGRTADYIGRDLPNVVSLFLHASKEDRVKRLLARKDVDTEQEALSMLDRKDANRSDYYNYYTGRKWGKADNYDLTLNTSRLSVEQIADLVLTFLNHRCEQ
ncbi:MAG: cytidylate kinase-like family protein [Muribaculaceae bacterium]|nr:cytidylate kinase-like family protein [Muribaculaceae bacterium]